MKNIFFLKVTFMNYKTELNRDTRVNQSLEGMGVVKCKDIDVLFLSTDLLLGHAISVLIMLLPLS